MKKDEFKPYIPADKITPEFTVTSVIMGILLAIIFGAANEMCIRDRHYSILAVQKPVIFYIKWKVWYTGYIVNGQNGEWYVYNFNSG